MTRLSIWLFRLMLSCCPREFRIEYADELFDTLRAREVEVGQGRGLWRFRARECVAILRAGQGLRRVRRRRVMEVTMLGRDGSWTTGLGSDARQAFRALLKYPAHTSIALLTLAVAVGAATAVFSVLNAVVLRPLPYPEADRLVRIRDAAPPRFPSFSVSPGRFLAWQDRNRSYEGVAATTPGYLSLTGAGDPERLYVSYSSPSLFDVLRVPPALGRGFTIDDDRPEAPSVVVLSDGLWQTSFGGRPDIIGQRVMLDDEPVTVVGVMPAAFEWPSADVRAWMPMRWSERTRQNYGSHYLQVVGRVQPGVSVASARQDLERVAADLAAELPGGNEGWTALVDPLHDYTIRNVRRGLLLLIAAAGGVLLIACFNVAGLLLARGADRQRELAVRSALGASRGRLVRQMLIENLALGVIGSAAGVALALAGLRTLLAASWTSLPRIAEVPFDWVSVGFAAGLALLTPLLFGLLPALQLSGGTVVAALASGGRTNGSMLRSRTRATLIVVEVALAVMLVAGSGLLLRSLDRLLRVDLGFEPEQVLTIAVSLPASRYQDDSSRSRFFSELVDRVDALPGVVQASASQAVPFLNDYVSQLTFEGREVDPEGPPTANIYAVTPGYFNAMHIPLIAGRDFRDTDVASAPRVAVVSRQIADTFYDDGLALGQRILVSQGPRQDFAEIVGIVDDVRQYGLDRMTYQIYEPATQHPYFASMRLVIRTSVPPETVTGAVRGTVLDLDPKLPIADATLLDRLVVESTGPRRFTTALLGGLAGIALLLAAVGTYALVSFSVGRRTQEFGIRLALGAAPGSITRLVVGQGLQLALVGVAIGVIGGIFGSRLLDSLMFEVSTTDPLAFIIAPLVLLAAVLVACWAPARRALRVSPVAALRHR